MLISHNGIFDFLNQFLLFVSLYSWRRNETDFLYTIWRYFFLLFSKLVVQWTYVHQWFIERWHSKWISLFRHWALGWYSARFRAYVFLSKSFNKTFRLHCFPHASVAWHNRKNQMNAIEEISDKNAHSPLECVWNHRCHHVWQTCGIVIYRTDGEFKRLTKIIFRIFYLFFSIFCYQSMISNSNRITTLHQKVIHYMNGGVW